MKFIVLSVFLLVYNVITSQLDPRFIQFWENPAQRNPAQLVGDHHIEAGLFSMFRSFDETTVQSAHALDAGVLIEKYNVAVGMRAAYFSETGRDRNWGYLQANYRVALGSFLICAGAEAGLYQMSLDANSFGSTSLDGSRQQDKVLDTGFGIKVSQSIWWVDASVLHIGNPSFTDFAQRVPQMLNVGAGLRIYAGGEVYVLPSVVFRNQSKADSWAVNLTLDVNQAVKAGVSWSPNSWLNETISQQLAVNGGMTIGQNAELLIAYKWGSPYFGSTIEGGIALNLD